MAERLAGHPNVANLVDCAVLNDGVNPKVSMLVYDYAGQSLHQYMRSRDGLVPGEHVARLCMRHIALALCHLNEHGLVHGDVHPKNLLVSNLGAADARFILADLGSAFEAGPNYHCGVFEYCAPERLMQSVCVGHRADVFSLGCVFATMGGLSFHFAQANYPFDQLTAITVQLGFPSAEEMPAEWRSQKCSHLASQPKPFDKKFRQTYGSAALDLLGKMLTMVPSNRSDAVEVSHHLFCRGERAGGLGPRATVEVFTGERHSWTVQRACVAQEVLAWLRADFAKPLSKEMLGPADEFKKHCITGCTDDACTGTFLNARSIQEKLPAPHVRAWICAFRYVNTQTFAAFYAMASRRLHASVGVVGQNGQHFLDSDWHTWLLQGAEIHFFPKPNCCVEPKHMDGAASVIHAGLTLYGRRTVVFDQTDGLAPVVLENFPGLFYIGGVTGSRHQVSHQKAYADETLHGASVAVMFRCDLFPYNRARCMGTTPSPKAVWDVIVDEVLTMLGQNLVLPSLQQCQAFL